jgi:hypothetical protein
MEDMADTVAMDMDAGGEERKRPANKN